MMPALRRAVPIACALMLAGCGSVPQRGEISSKRPGGYYLDDGPLDRVPVDLDRVPDAAPRLEPIKASTSRPYTVMGQTYLPMTALTPYKASGIASWYGRRYHGQPTASGEIYDMFAMSAAHPTLPIPSYARVTQIETQRSVVVRVNDRGPFRSDRLIDLSYTAAYKLGILNAGRANVVVETVLPPFDPALPDAAQPGSAAVSNANGIAHERRESPPPAPSNERTAASAEPLPPGAYLQLGAFAQQENAQSFAARLRAELDWLAARMLVRAEGGIFRVQAGPFADTAQASEAAVRVRDAFRFEPLVFTR
ncbi:MAG TPA: septal ring lytic transglycosylase RlpA family protein [Burkholderiales bacterium]|nr:septal ring lytic transglycosylase RlpA family protein [Burkholderiales bacterium]